MWLDGLRGPRRPMKSPRDPLVVAPDEDQVVSPVGMPWATPWQTQPQPSLESFQRWRRGPAPVPGGGPSWRGREASGPEAVVRRQGRRSPGGQRGVAESVGGDG